MSAEMWTGLAAEFEAASEHDTVEILERVYRAIWPDDPRAWWKAGWRYAPHGAYTDAVLALIAETLPGWGILGLHDTARGPEGALVIMGCTVELSNCLIDAKAKAATRALALLAAVCRAKAAQAEAGGSPS